jgi:hypothetical protein
MYIYLIINIDIRIIILFIENIVYIKEIIEDGENEVNPLPPASQKASPKFFEKWGGLARYVLGAVCVPSCDVQARKKSERKVKKSI